LRVGAAGLILFGLQLGIALARTALAVVLRRIAIRGAFGCGERHRDAGDDGDAADADDDPRESAVTDVDRFLVLVLAGLRWRWRRFRIGFAAVERDVHDPRALAFLDEDDLVVRRKARDLEAEGVLARIDVDRLAVELLEDR